MRCDDVFEILTSGPFPNGAASDEAVELHLECCHECRRFAEALRPLGDVALDSDLPTYDGRLMRSAASDEPVNLVNRVQFLVVKEHEKRQAEKHQTEKNRRAFATKGFTRFVAACAAVFVLGAAAALAGPLLVGRFTPRQNAPSLVLASSEKAPTNQNGVCGSEILSHLKQNAIIPVSFQESKDACCIQCHGGPSKAPEKKQTTIGLVVMSCQKCHVERPNVARM
jgi:hypothetical protein